jgi:hypothetical protein
VTFILFLFPMNLHLLAHLGSFTYGTTNDMNIRGVVYKTLCLVESVSMLAFLVDFCSVQRINMKKNKI